MILAFSLGDRVVNHFASRCVTISQAQDKLLEGELGLITYDFALPREQNQVARNPLSQSMSTTPSTVAYLMAMREMD